MICSSIELRPHHGVLLLRMEDATGPARATVVRLILEEHASELLGREPEGHQGNAHRAFEQPGKVLRLPEVQLKRRFVGSEGGAQPQTFGFLDEGVMDVLLRVLAGEDAQHIAEVGRKIETL